MSNLFTKDSPTNTLEDEINEEQIDDKENRDKVSKYIFFSFLNYFHFIHRLMEYPKPRQILHQKVGIINPTRKKRKTKEKRKINQHLPNQLINHL
jgi:hypothetical protein